MYTLSFKLLIHNYLTALRDIKIHIITYIKQLQGEYTRMAAERALVRVVGMLMVPVERGLMVHGVVVRGVVVRGVMG